MCMRTRVQLVPSCDREHSEIQRWTTHSESPELATREGCGRSPSRSARRGRTHPPCKIIFLKCKLHATLGRHTHSSPNRVQYFVDALSLASSCAPLKYTAVYPAVHILHAIALPTKRRLLTATWLEGHAPGTHSWQLQLQKHVGRGTTTRDEK